MTETTPGGQADIRPNAEKRAGEQLRRLRNARGWKLRDVAERMTGYGYRWHQTVVAKIETGQRPLRLNEALDLAALFGVSLTDLLVPARGSASLEEVQGELTALRTSLEEAEKQAREAQLQAAEAAQGSAVASAAVESIRSRIQLLEKWEAEALGDGQA